MGSAARGHVGFLVFAGRGGVERGHYAVCAAGREVAHKRRRKAWNPAFGVLLLVIGAHAVGLACCLSVSVCARFQFERHLKTRSQTICRGHVRLLC